MLAKAGVRSTQRLAIGDVGGGIAMFTWPAELVDQAAFLYRDDLPERLVAAARDGGWEIDIRPHLAFWRSHPSQRLYMNPTEEMTVDDYVRRWRGHDAEMIGAHDLDSLRDTLWPLLLERGYATEPDTREFPEFLQRLRAVRRDAHLRPGLRLLYRVSRADVRQLETRNELARELRSVLNRLLLAIGDEPLQGN
jgi:hypothetical protein